MKVSNRKQRPSVKRLRRRRIALDLIKQKIHKEGVQSLGSKQRAFYDDQKKFDDQDLLGEIAHVVQVKGSHTLTNEQREFQNCYQLRCRVASLMATNRVSDISSEEENIYKDLLKMKELKHKIKASGIKKLFEEERSLYNEHLENKRKWRS